MERRRRGVHVSRPGIFDSTVGFFASVIPNDVSVFFFSFPKQ